MALHEGGSRGHVETFRRFATEVPVALFQTALDGHCIFVNRKWSELTGLPEGAASGRGWIDSIDLRDRPRVLREWFGAPHGSEFAIEWRTATGPAVGRKVRASVGLLWDDEGAVIGYAVALAQLPYADATKALWDQRNAESAVPRRQPAVLSGVT